MLEGLILATIIATGWGFIEWLNVRRRAWLIEARLRSSSRDVR